MKFKGFLIITMSLLMGFSAFISCSNSIDNEPSTNTNTIENSSFNEIDSSKDTPYHEHTYSTDWNNDSFYHWHDDNCGHNTRSNEEEHNYSKWEVVIEASEESEGEKQRRCTTCGYVDIGTIEKLEHTHKYSTYWTSNESYHWHGDTCGHGTKTDEEEHNFSQWQVVIEATEESEGSKERTCKTCGYVDIESIEKLEHTHKYLDYWTSNESYHWHDDACGHGTKTDEEEHNFSQWEVVLESTEESEGSKERTCKTCGYVDIESIEKLEHTHKYITDWSSDEYCHWHDDACGHGTKTDEEEHNYSEWQVLIEATEESEGSKQRTCKTCGYVDIGTIEKLEHTHKYSTYWTSNESYHWHGDTCGHGTKTDEEEHNFSQWEVITEATEYSEGKKQRTCKTCGYVDAESIEKLEHTHKYSTYWTSNESYHWHGDTCGHGTKTDEEEHTYGEWKVITEATEYSEGKKQRTCKTCGYVDAESIEKLEHTHKYSTYWSKDEYGHYHSDTCGHETKIDEAKHTFGEWRVVTEATTSYNGLEERKCTICGYCQTRKTDKVKVTITFDSNGGSEVETLSAYYGDSIDVVPTKEGYTFDGWYDSTFTTKYNDIPEEDITLYANWYMNGIKYGNYVNVDYVIIEGYEGDATDVIIPSVIEGKKVTVIQSYSFNNCTNLTSIVIPDTVTLIRGYAFYDCSNLTRVTLGNNVSTIETYAFKNCTNLKSIKIPDSVTMIGIEAFYNCTSLTSVTIGNGVTSIGEYAFYNCNNLKYVTLGNGLVSIGQCAFQNCVSLIEIIIPDGVTSIGRYAFGNCTSLTSIVIPDSVTKIGYQAFYNCIILTSVTIGNGVTTIGQGAFSNCTSLTSATISNSATSIEQFTFYNCTNLTKIVIPDSVTEIGYQAFYNCTSLTSVTIGNGVTSIGESAFYNCKSLTSVTLGSSLSSIGSYAFSGCYHLVEVINKSSLNITKGSSDYGYIGLYAINIKTDGATNIVNKDNYLFLTYNNVNYLIQYIGENTSFVLPSDYNGESYEINRNAFYNNTEITNIVIPDSVTSIGTNAFYNCTSLTSVTIGNGVTSIGAHAFSNCTSLTKIVIPDSITSIESDAFSRCSSLRSVTLGNGVTTIGLFAFRGCYHLVEVINKSSLNITKGSTNYGWIGYFALNIKTSGTSDIVNKDGYLFLTSIEDSTNYLIGYVDNDTSLVLPSDYNGETYKIFNYAFSNCTNLTSIVIPDSVTSIESYAFSNCTSLTSIVIPDSVTSIGSDAFSGCSSLRSVTLGNGVTYIGSEAFGNCSSLTTIYYNGTIADWLKIESDYYSNSLPNINTNFEYFYILDTNGNVINNDNKYSLLTEVIIPEGTTLIGENAFRNFKHITSVIIPDSVTTIGTHAFFNCTNLKYNEYDNAYYLGNDNNPYFALIIVKSNEIKSCIVHDNCKVIADSSFTTSGITSITLSSNVTYIGKFDYCDSIRIIYYNGTIEDWLNIKTDSCNYLPNLSRNFEYFYILDNNGTVTNNGNKYSLLTEIIIPEGTTSIRWYAFYNFKHVTSVVIPDSVTSIGSYAFVNCTSLITLTIPDNVTSIGRNAFYNCTNLTSVTLGNSVTTIEDYVFSNCYSLVEVINKSSLYISKGSNKYGNIGYYALIIKISGDSDIVIKDNYLFYKYNGVNYLIKYIGNDTSLVLPSDYNGESYEIYKYVFYNNSNITSVTIPNSVTSIGSYAFYNCINLTDIYYSGTEEDWNNINLGTNNASLTKANIHYNSI